MNNPIFKAEIGDVISGTFAPGAHVVTRIGAAYPIDESSHNICGNEISYMNSEVRYLLGIARIFNTIQVGDIISTGCVAGGGLFLVQSASGSARETFVRATKFNESCAPSASDPVLEFHMSLPWFTTNVRSVLLWGRFENGVAHRTHLPLIIFNRELQGR